MLCLRSIELKTTSREQESGRRHLGVGILTCWQKWARLITLDNSRSQASNYYHADVLADILAPLKPLQKSGY